MLDSQTNIIAGQIYDLFKIEDLDSLVYLCQSLIPRLYTFWDKIAYIQSTALIFEISSFLDLYEDKTVKKKLIANFFTQLEEAEQLVMKNGDFELFWILPYLKILHSPETIITTHKIIYRQELANFLETEIKLLPTNMGFLIIEIIISLLVKARNDIIELHELQQTLNLIHTYLDNLVTLEYISSTQNAYLREYFVVFFPLPRNLQKNELLSWIEQRTRAVNEVDKHQLLPYEQMRLELAIRDLEIARLHLLQDSSNYKNLLNSNLENSFRALQNVKRTGLILDHAFLENNVLEIIALVVQEPETDIDQKLKLSLEGVSYAKQLLRMMDYIEPNITLGFSNTVLLALSIFAPHLVRKTKDVFEANRIMLEVSKLSIEKNRQTLSQPHELSGEFFNRLARVFYALGCYSPLEYQNRIRALKNASTYSKQATSIFKFVSSTEELNSVVLEFETESRIFLIMSENPMESDIELEAINEEAIRTLEKLVSLIIVEDRWRLISEFGESLLNYLTKAMKISSNPNQIRQKLITMQESIISRIDAVKYANQIQIINSFPV